MKKRDIYLFIILIIAIFGIHITNNNYYEFNNKTEQYTSKVISKLSYESYIQPILTKNNIDIFLSEFSDDIEEININIEQLKSDLNRAKTELTTAISNNEAEIDAKIAALNTAIENAEEAANYYSDEQDAALKAELLDLINTTKTDIIKYIDSELAKAKTSFESKLAMKANKPEIAAEIARLDSLISAAESVSKSYTNEQDAALKEELKNLITTTKTDIIKYIDEELSKVNEKLDNIFNFVYNESEVDAKLAELRSNIENAEKVTKLYSDEQDAALKEELKNLVTTTKTDIIKYIDEELSKVNEELDNIFKFVYNKAEIDAKLAALRSNIENAEKATKLYSDEQDAALKEELKNLITTIKTDIIKYIDDELAKAKTSFESKLAIKANKPEIDAEIARLDALISAAESVSKTYTDEQDAALKEELKNLITTTKTDIIKYIDEELSKVNDELDNIFNLVYNESEVDAKLAELRTFINSADNATKLYSDEQDAALKEELEDLINTTKTDIIKYIDEELSKVNEDLDNIFNSVYNENEVDAKLAELRTIIDNADKATKLYSDEQDIAIKKDLEAKILSVKNELLETINLINQRISKFDHDLLNLKKKIQILTISFSCCIGVLFILFGFLFVYFYKKNKKFIKKL